MYLTQQEINRIAAGVRAVKSYTSEQKIEVWEKAIEVHGDNSLLRRMQSREFKMAIGHSTDFCRKAEIPYTRMDEYWDYIRAGAAYANDIGAKKKIAA